MQGRTPGNHYSSDSDGSDTDSESGSDGGEEDDSLPAGWTK